MVAKKRDEKQTTRAKEVQEALLRAVEVQRLVDDGEKAVQGLSARLLKVAAQFQTDTAVGTVMETQDGDRTKIVGLEFPTDQKDKILDMARACAGDFSDEVIRQQNWMLSKECPEDKAYKDKSGQRIVPKSWAQMVSNLKRAMEMGIPLDNFTTESAVRNAKAAINRAEKEEKDRKAAREKARQQIQQYAQEGAETDFEEAAENTSTEAQNLMIALARHMSSLTAKVSSADMPKDRRKGFRQQLETTEAELAALVDSVKRQEDLADEVIKQVTHGQTPVKREGVAEHEEEHEEGRA